MKIADLVEAMDNYLEITVNEDDMVVVSLMRFGNTDALKYPFLSKNIRAFNIRRVENTTLFSIIRTDDSVSTSSWSNSDRSVFTSSSEELHRVILSFVKNKTSKDFYEGYNARL